MKINEIVLESHAGKLSKRHTAASQGITRFRDNGTDRVYNLNRVMMAAGMHDGETTNPVNMDTSSWAEKYNIAVPYTDEEHNMVQGALKTVGATSNEVVPHSKSEELANVNRTSPVQSRGPIALKKKK